MINILTSLCINCGAENIDWKKHHEAPELVSCYKCHSLYESDCNLISIDTVDSLRLQTPR